MRVRRILLPLLGLLVGIALISRLLQGQADQASPASRLFLTVFLFGLPLLLAGGLLVQARWTLMACVMYGTVGLALDISTVVHGLTRSQAGPPSLGLNAASGLVNFLLIVCGGRGFLDVGPAAGPRAGPPSNPPSPHAP